MFSTAEKTKGEVKFERPAAYFALDKNYSIDNLNWQGPVFRGMEDSRRYADFNNFLHLDDPDIRPVIDRAFEGKPSQIRFQRVFENQAYYYDLYCFPELAQDISSIGCFLVDRCRDEESARTLRQRIDRLDIINQAVRAFAETNNLTEILRIILLAVTSGPGLGFNRGFILLSDETKTFLHGCLATGPSSPEEAGEIWRSLSEKKLALAEVLRFYRSEEYKTDTYVNKLVTSLKIPLTDNNTIITKSFEERRAISIGPGTVLGDTERDLKENIGADSLAVAPLIAGESWLGIIIADNSITDKPITSSDLKLLEIFARYASDAIENTHLQGTLQRKIARLKRPTRR